MSSCILTIIKNEQEYLDEWIKYHLDLGIDHIFILEDIDSDSHKDICDKYGDRVSLNSVLSVLSEENINIAKEVKELKKYNVNHIYFREGLSYLQKNYSNKYEWCFVIDNDEFITIQNDKLDEVLPLFKDYDAFTMRWKCYGANGYVNKPSYEDKGLIETYTELAKCNIQETKTCYNLKRFRGEFLYTHHYPTNKCKWCGTDKIYLRHYITKSWEEYVWKRKVRGFPWGCTRDFDFFFKINTDMIPIKDKLIEQAKNEILVVLPYKQSGSQGNEIKIALSGWRKFCQFNYHFIVIGEFDETLKNEFPWVEFIYCKTKEKKEGQYNPHLDMQNKFKIVKKIYSQAYDGFIWMCDDNYPIKPFDFDDIKRIYCHSLSFDGCEKCPTSYWRYDKWKTRQLLDREGLPHINYTTHFPCYFEFKKLGEIWKKYNILDESYVVEDIYFNYFEHEKPIYDSTIRLGIWNKSIFDNEFQKAVDNPNIKFIVNSVEGWSKELEDELFKITS